MRFFSGNFWFSGNFHQRFSRFFVCFRNFCIIQYHFCLQSLLKKSLKVLIKRNRKGSKKFWGKFFFSAQCSANADCESTDANKECSSGSCVCKTGYYSDITGTCVTGKIKTNLSEKNNYIWWNYYWHISVKRKSFTSKIVRNFEN